MPKTNERESGNFPGEVQTEIRRQAAQQAAKWTIAATAALVAVAAAGWWFYLEPKIISRFGGVPPGTVIAFTQACPTHLGWKPYDLAAGKTIIGAGFGEFKDGTKLSGRALFDEGGEEKHKLEKEEMPGHTHRISTGIANDSTVNWHDGLAGGQDNYGIDTVFNDPNSGIRRNSGHGSLDKVLEETGGNLSHNNMPPFVALQYCIKD